VLVISWCARDIWFSKKSKLPTYSFWRIYLVMHVPLRYRIQRDCHRTAQITNGLQRSSSLNAFITVLGSSEVALTISELGRTPFQWCSCLCYHHPLSSCSPRHTTTGTSSVLSNNIYSFNHVCYCLRAPNCQRFLYRCYTFLTL
jgi:hypothetical protein